MPSRTRTGGEPPRAGAVLRARAVESAPYDGPPPDFRFGEQCRSTSIPPPGRLLERLRRRRRGRAGPRRSSSGARSELIVNARASGTGGPRGPRAGDGARCAPRARASTRTDRRRGRLAAAVRAADGRRVVLVGGDGTVHAFANLGLGALPAAALLPPGRPTTSPGRSGSRRLGRRRRARGARPPGGRRRARGRDAGAQAVRASRASAPASTPPRATATTA